MAGRLRPNSIGRRQGPRRYRQGYAMNCARCRSCGYTYPENDLHDETCYNCAPVSNGGGFTFETIGGLVKGKVIEPAKPAPEESKSDHLGPLFG